jgi:tetratricopeptide (TPR) repeat protein
VTRAGLVLVSVLALAGCGDPTLWARYRAERAFWHARRLIERAQVNPRLVKPQDLDQATAAFRRIADEFPPSIWAGADRVRNPRARDVAMISGDAHLAVGRLEEARGNPAQAIEVYRRTREEFAAVPPIRLKALLAEAGARERLEGPYASTFLYAEITRSIPLVDTITGEAVRPALDAPLRVASDLVARGQRTEADSVLGAGEARLLAEAERHRGKAAAPELWTGVARIRAARAKPDIDLTLEALRMALAEPAAKPIRSGLVLNLSEYCLQGHRPDSALVYARWAEREFERGTRAKATALQGRIWEQVNVDSAIAVYGRFIDSYPNDDQGLMVRFRRAELYEQQGRWEEGRAELRSLVTLNPTDELAFQASERIVAHHLRAGEKDLARIEAQRALEGYDRLLSTVQDDETLMRIRQEKARMLLAIEDWGEACAALADLWGRYGQTDIGASAGFHAAEVAEHQLNDKGRARHLYEELAARGPKPGDQERARRELQRLRQEEGRG